MKHTHDVDLSHYYSPFDEPPKVVDSFSDERWLSYEDELTDVADAAIRHYGFYEKCDAKDGYILQDETLDYPIGGAFEEADNELALILLNYAVVSAEAFMRDPRCPERDVGSLVVAYSGVAKKFIIAISEDPMESCCYLERVRFADEFRVTKDKKGHYHIHPLGIGDYPGKPPKTPTKALTLKAEAA
jgi:hypothetical protein